MDGWTFLIKMFLAVSALFWTGCGSFQRCCGLVFLCQRLPGSRLWRAKACQPFCILPRIRMTRPSMALLPTVYERKRGCRLWWSRFLMAVITKDRLRGGARWRRLARFWILLLRDRKRMGLRISAPLILGYAVNRRRHGENRLLPWRLWLRGIALAWSSRRMRRIGIRRMKACIN